MCKYLLYMYVFHWYINPCEFCSNTLLFFISKHLHPQQKCERYWPEDGEMKVGEITVSLTTTQVFADYTIHRLHLKKVSFTRVASLFDFYFFQLKFKFKLIIAFFTEIIMEMLIAFIIETIIIIMKDKSLFHSSS